jgi:hypothetical protein
MATPEGLGLGEFSGYGRAGTDTEYCTVRMK